MGLKTDMNRAFGETNQQGAGDAVTGGPKPCPPNWDPNPHF